MLHDEVNCVSAFSASEAFAEPLGGGDVKGRGSVIMKRAKPDKVHAPFFQCYKFGHHFFYPCSIHNAFDSCPVYHCFWVLVKQM